MNASDELRRRKKVMRRAVREARDALSPDERGRRSDAILRRLFALDGFEEARTVMVFLSFGSEVDTAPIIRRLADEGRRVAVPRIQERDLVAVGHRPGDPLTRAPFGAMEPSDGEVLAPREIDAVVTPGLAFDRRGYRVGYGGGFYDRFLPKIRPEALRVGICFGVQVADEVPHGGADQAVDVVVTDEEVIRCR